MQNKLFSNLNNWTSLLFECVWLYEYSQNTSNNYYITII